MQRCQVQFLASERPRGKCFLKPTLKGKVRVGLSHSQSTEIEFQWCVAWAAGLVRKRNETRSGKKWAEAIDQARCLMLIAKFLNRIF